MRGLAMERRQAEIFSGCFYMKAPCWPGLAMERSGGAGGSPVPILLLLRPPCIPGWRGMKAG